MRIAILLILVVCIGQVAAEEAGDAASRLLSSQNADGSWSGAEKGPESQIYTTAKVLNGLMRYGEKSEAVDNGIKWIELQDSGDIAGLSEVVGVLRSSGRSPESELLRLKEYQNADGGWGKTAEFKSTPWYTSTAIIALNRFEEYRDASIAGGEYLLSEQGEDGSFEDSTLITSNCIYALVLLYDAAKRDEFVWAAIQGYEWLNKTAGQGGVWDGVASTSNSIIALDALYRLTGDGDLKALTDNAKRWIVSSPGNKSDYLSTAWALTALTQKTPISPIEPKASISASLTKEYVFPSEGTEIRFELENPGIANLKNVSLSLVTPRDLHAEIGKTEWKIDGLQRGGSREFAESIFIAPDVKEGEYPVTITADSINSTVHLHVLKFPLLFEMGPTELKNDAPFDFELLVKNQGQDDIFIKNVAPDIDENWRDVKINRVQLDMPSGSEKSVVLFSATAPEERGEYHGAITIDFIHPELGERQIVMKQKFLVSGAVPSGILKLVFYGALILSVILLLNLLIGYDLLR